MEEETVEWLSRIEKGNYGGDGIELAKYLRDKLLKVLETIQTAQELPKYSDRLLIAIQKDSKLCSHQEIAELFIDCCSVLLKLPGSDELTLRSKRWASNALCSSFRLKLFSSDDLQHLAGDLRFSCTSILHTADQIIREKTQNSSAQVFSVKKPIKIDELFEKIVISFGNNDENNLKELGEICASNNAAWARVLELSRTICTKSRNVRRSICSIFYFVLNSLLLKKSIDPLNVLFRHSTSAHQIARTLSTMLKFDPKDFCQEERRQFRFGEINSIMDLIQQTPKNSQQIENEDEEFWMCVSTFFEQWIEFSILSIPFTKVGSLMRNTLCSFISFVSIPHSLSTKRQYISTMISKFLSSQQPNDASIKVILPESIRIQLFISLEINNFNTIDDNLAMLFNSFNSKSLKTEAFVLKSLFNESGFCCSKHESSISSILSIISK